MIRKLFAGASVLAVVAAALLLMTVGTSANAKPAEATVADIGTTVSSIGSNTFALIQVNAQDDFLDFPNSPWDLDITASAGEFLELDPTQLAPGCTDQGGDASSPKCEVNSNGFGQSNTFAPGGGPVGTTVNTSTFTDTLSILNSFATGTTHIQVCNNHGFEPDAWAAGDPAATAQPGGNPCANNTSHVEAWWQAPPGFLGGTVTFCATQTNTVCDNLTVVGAVASLELFAFREASTETSQCKGTPVHVIASSDYTFNPADTFDNNRAILCVEARDSAGTLVNAQNITWTTTAGVLGSNVTNTGGPPANVNNANNMLTSGGSTASGTVAKVTAAIGSATDFVEIEFGGDPASCAMTISPELLDIGDNAAVTVVLQDAEGNKVPDGVLVHFAETDSGDGSDNVQLVDNEDDTVNSVAGASVIGAISGLTTISASVDTTAAIDPVCSEAIELSGDVHVHPSNCEDEDLILFGNQPPAGGGFGTFAFCGGSWESLLEASGCPEATSVFFYNDPSGGFEVWIPGSDVAAVNAEILARWPNEHDPIPEGTIFTAKCK